MKRKYSYRYLEHKTGSPLGVAQWAEAKRKEIAKQTGVKWTAAVVGGGMQIRFSPVLNFREIETAGTEADQAWVMALIELLSCGQRGGILGCVDLGDVLELAITRPAPFVLGVIKGLVQAGRLHMQVNRQGKPTMVNIPRSDR